MGNVSGGAQAPGREEYNPAEKCVIYARYSSTNQNDASIEQQIAECRKFAEARGLEVVGTYEDRALSGTNDNRPSFLRMINDSARRRWETVLVYKLDRFSRNRYDAATYKHRLKKNGVMVLYVMEPIPDGPGGILMESILEGSAEYYSANLSQNVRRGQQAAARAGMAVGYMALGYVRGPDGKPAIDTAGADLVREIFRRAAAGEGYTAICRDLNARGLTTSRGTPWQCPSLLRVLGNPAYIGLYRYGAVVMPGGMPRIVDQGTWAAVQIRLNPPGKVPVTKRVRARNYLLSGYAFCGLCGRRLTGNTGRERAYYRCKNGPSGPECTLGFMRAEPLEDTVISATVDSLLEPDAISWIADRVMEVQATEEASGPAAELRQKLAENEKAVSNIVKAIESGFVSQALQARLRELEAEAEALRADIHADAVSRPHLEKSAVAFWLSQFKDGDSQEPGFRERLVHSLIQRVEVFQDKVRIVYNYTGPGGGLAEKVGPIVVKETLSGESFLNLQNGVTVYFVGPLLIAEVAVKLRFRHRPTPRP